MKKTLSLSALLLMSTAPVFAQDAILLEEIVVNATLAPTEAWKSGATFMEVTKDDFTPTASATQVLRAIPGVSITQRGAIGGLASVSMRGLTQEYFTVSRDGIDMTDPSGTKTAFQGFNSISSNSIQSVQVLKGAQSALYGSSAISGAINMTTLDLDAAEYGQSHSVDLGFGSNATMSGGYTFIQKNDRLSLGIAATAYKTDGISSAARQNGISDAIGTENVEKDGYDSNSLTVAAQYQVSDTLKIGGTVFRESSKNDFDEFYWDDNGTPDNYWDDISGPFDGSPDETTTSTTVGARVYAEMQRNNWNHLVSVSALDIDRQSESPTVTSPSATASSPRFKSNRQAFSYVATGEISQSMTLSFGADTKREEAKGDVYPGGSKSTTTTGIFAEMQYQPTENWSIIANLRNDTHSDFGAFQSYRLNTAYKIAESTVLRASVAQSYRAPAISELYAVYKGGTPTVGNPDLNPETTLSYEFGIDHYFAGGASASLVFYETEFKDLISWKKGALQSTYENIDTARAKGTEFSLNMPLGDKTDVGVSFVTTQWMHGGGYRVGNSYGNQTTLNLGHQVSDALKANVQVVSASDPTTWGGDDYTLVNVSANYQLNDAIELYANIENVNDIQYQTQKDFSMPGRTIFAGVRASF